MKNVTISGNSTWSWSIPTTRWDGCNLFSDWIYVLRKILHIKWCVHTVKSSSGTFQCSCPFMRKQACVKLHHWQEMWAAHLISGSDRKHGHFKPHSQSYTCNRRVILYPLFIHEITACYCDQKTPVMSGTNLCSLTSDVCRLNHSKPKERWKKTEHTLSQHLKLQSPSLTSPSSLPLCQTSLKLAAALCPSIRLPQHLRPRAHRTLHSGWPELQALTHRDANTPHAHKDRHTYGYNQGQKLREPCT